MTTRQETQQAEARQSIIDEAVLNAYVGMLQSDVIAAALADVPRVMQAIGAYREQRKVAIGPDGIWRADADLGDEERWVTDRVEVDGE